MDLKFKSEIKRKVKMKQNLTKLRITNNLNRMNKEIQLEEQILDKYNKEYNKKLNYLEKHKEIEKTWKKQKKIPIKKFKMNPKMIQKYPHLI